MNWLIENLWINLLLLLLIALALTKVLTFILIRLIKKITSITKNDKDDELLVKIENPLIYLITFFVIKILLTETLLDPSTIIILERIVLTAMILLAGRIASITFELLLTIWNAKLSSSENRIIDPQLVRLFSRAVAFIVYSISFIYILTVWKIEIIPILGSLGIAGLAVAFALQETLKNFFGGIQLILDKNISQGDIVELSSGISGIIYDMTLRSTRIKTWDNKIIIIPNGVLANDIVTNISQPDRSRRITVSFGTEYGSDPDYVKAIVKEEILAIENVEKEDPEPRVVFKQMGDSALLFEAWYWVKDLSNFLTAKEDGTTKIYERLNRERIGIPFPQQTVWFNDMGKYTNKPYEKKILKSKEESSQKFTKKKVLTKKKLSKRK